MKWYRVIITPYQLQQYATEKSQRQVPVRMLRRGDVPSWYWGHQWPPVAGSATSRRSAQTAVLGSMQMDQNAKVQFLLTSIHFNLKLNQLSIVLSCTSQLNSLNVEQFLVCFSIPFTRLMPLSLNVVLLKSTVTGLNVTIIIDVEF